MKKLKLINYKSNLVIWFALLFFSLFSGHVQAVSRVFIQNDTSLKINLVMEEVGEKSSIFDWKQSQQILFPWKPLTKVLSFHRHRGIKRGKEYTFIITLKTPDNQEIVRLHHKLTGRLISSKMMIAVNGSNVDDSWKNDNQIHTYELKVKDQSFLLKYKISKGFNSDITYLLHQKNVSSTTPINTSKNKYELYLLTYNLYGVFTQGKNDILQRFTAASEILSGYDVIFFEEAFSKESRNILISKIKNEYPYITSVVDSPSMLKVTSGGIFVASKWPIEKVDQHIYQTCGFPDCFSAKGVQYVRVNKMGIIYNLFATHINWDGHPLIRGEQWKEMKRFIESKKIPKEEPIIMGGDFNTDLINYPQSYEKMLSMFNCEAPTLVGYPYSCDSTINKRVSINKKIRIDQSRLDYIFTIKDHWSPIVNKNEVKIVKSTNDILWGDWNYSDHFPVAAHLIFQAPSLSTSSGSSSLVYSTVVSSSSISSSGRLSNSASLISSSSDIADLAIPPAITPVSTTTNSSSDNISTSDSTALSSSTSTSISL